MFDCSGTSGSYGCKDTNSSGYYKTLVTTDSIYLRSTSRALFK